MFHDKNCCSQKTKGIVSFTRPFLDRAFCMTIYWQSHNLTAILNSYMYHPPKRIMIFKGRIKNNSYGYVTESTIEAAFDNGRNHFKLLGGVKAVPGMGGYGNAFSQF